MNCVFTIIVKYVIKTHLLIRPFSVFTVCQLFCAFSYWKCLYNLWSPVLLCDRQGKSLDVVITYESMRKWTWCFGSGNSGKGTTCVLVLSSTPGQRAVSDRVNEASVFDYFQTVNHTHRFSQRPHTLWTPAWIPSLPFSIDSSARLLR